MPQFVSTYLYQGQGIEGISGFRDVGQDEWKDEVAEKKIRGAEANITECTLS